MELWCRRLTDIVKKFESQASRCAELLAGLRFESPPDCDEIYVQTWDGVQYRMIKWQKCSWNWLSHNSRDRWAACYVGKLKTDSKLIEKRTKCVACGTGKRSSLWDRLKKTSSCLWDRWVPECNNKCKM